MDEEWDLAVLLHRLQQLVCLLQVLHCALTYFG